MQHLATFAAVRKRLRQNARPAHTPERPQAPDPHATLLRLVAAPVPLTELPAVAQAAGIKRSVAQVALNDLLRHGEVVLRHAQGGVLVVAAEGGAP